MDSAVLSNYYSRASWSDFQPGGGGALILQTLAGLPSAFPRKLTIVWVRMLEFLGCTPLDGRFFFYKNSTWRTEVSRHFALSDLWPSIDRNTPEMPHFLTWRNTLNTNVRGLQDFPSWACKILWVGGSNFPCRYFLVEFPGTPSVAVCSFP